MRGVDPWRAARLLPVVLAACGPVSEGSPARPVPAGPPPACAEGSLPVAGACSPRIRRTVEVPGGSVTLRLAEAAHRAWWFTPHSVTFSEATSACRAVGGEVLLPRDLEELGVAAHFATLAAVVGQPGAVWVDLRLDLASGLLLGPSDEPVIPFRPGTPPLPGVADDSRELDVQAAVDAVVRGEAPDPQYTCFRIDSDAAVRPERCRIARVGVVCRPLTPP